MFNYSIVTLITCLTILVYVFYYKRISGTIPKLALLIAVISIFIYSGYGISMPEVSNLFIVKYVISIICFAFPFFVLFNSKKTMIVYQLGWFDSFLETHIKLVRIIAIFYLFFTLFPCVFPNFKLFDVLFHGISIADIYDQYNASKDSSLLRLMDSLKMFCSPFFYAYLVYMKYKKPSSISSILLLAFCIYLEIARYSYIGRYQIVVDFLMLYLFSFCFRENGFHISKKQIVVLSSVAVASVPFMYAYMFIRYGGGVDSMPFSQSLDLLLESEAYYPQYYEHIVSSNVLKEESFVGFLLWLICLPIPSVIWPGKPTLHNDIFTYSITGLHRVDVGYSSLLPSYLGESMIYFGEHFYWVYALIVGYVFASILKFLIKNDYLIFFAVVLSLRLLTVGRAGATAALPTFINGSLLLYVIYIWKSLVSK